MLHIQQSQLQTPIFKSNNCASLDMKLWTLGLKFWNICQVGRICYFTTICESVWKTNRFHSIVSTVANQAFQKYFFSPYVLLQLLLISRWVTRSLRVQLNLCGGPSPPNKFFPDPQNLQDWRTANFFQMSPLLYDGINERYCFLLRVLLPLTLFPLVSIRLTKQSHFVAAKSEQNYSDCEQRRRVWGNIMMMITSWFGKEGYIREGCSNLH